MSASKTPPEENSKFSRDRRSHGEDYPGAPDDGSSESRYASPPAAPERKGEAKPKPRRTRGRGRGDATAALRFGPEPDDE